MKMSEVEKQAMSMVRIGAMTLLHEAERRERRRLAGMQMVSVEVGSDGQFAQVNDGFDELSVLKGILESLVDLEKGAKKRRMMHREVLMTPDVPEFEDWLREDASKQFPVGKALKISRTTTSPQEVIPPFQKKGRAQIAACDKSDYDPRKFGGIIPHKTYKQFNDKGNYIWVIMDGEKDGHWMISQPIDLIEEAVKAA